MAMFMMMSSGRWLQENTPLRDRIRADPYKYQQLAREINWELKQLEDKGVEIKPLEPPKKGPEDVIVAVIATFIVMWLVGPDYLTSVNISMDLALKELSTMSLLVIKYALLGGFGLLALVMLLGYCLHLTGRLPAKLLSGKLTARDLQEQKEE